MSSRRVGYLDWLRLLAAVLVVAVHTVQAMIVDWQADAVQTKMYVLAVSYGMCCNALFVMLSGALLLRREPEAPWEFYKRRFLRVLVPAAAYYLFYYLFSRGGMAGLPESLFPSNWTVMVREFLANSNGFAPHFWLIHVILACYLAAPFLLLMVRHMDETAQAAFAVVILAVQGAAVAASEKGIVFSSSTVLTSWETVFVFGYLCTTPLFRRHERLILGAGAASALFMAAAVFGIDGYGALIYNHTPVMLLFSAAVFLFFQKHGGDWFKQVPRVLMPFTKYSFSILMIHWYVLHFVVEEKLGISGASICPAVGIPLTIVLTLLFSLAFAVVYDHTVVFCLDKLCRWVLGFLETAYENIRRKQGPRGSGG